LSGKSISCDTVFPNHKVVTDVGSGVNFKRKGLLSLLTPAAQALSEKSWLPIETGSPELATARLS
jgi:hypothetical protein